MTKRSIVLIALLILVASSTGNAGEPRLSHDPISIQSDDEFVIENGVVGGSGTISDPYLIVGWTIDAQSGVGIRVQEVSAHVLIQDCQITGAGQRGIGILLSGVSQVRVLDCSFSDLGSGIFLYQSPGVSLEDNALADCRRGIEGTESGGITLLGTEIVESKEHGIFLWRCHDASLKGNTVLDCRNGIYLDSCHRNALDENRVEGADHGIFLWDCFDCVIVDNILSTCGLGLALVHTSERNTVFHNVFVMNARHATCDEEGNLWDDGYPLGGNYWEGEPVADAFSRPEQSQSGADGISDVAIQILFTGIDRYPLMAVPAEGG